jgi:hypothetical protein
MLLTVWNAMRSWMTLYAEQQTTAGACRAGLPGCGFLAR